MTDITLKSTAFSADGTRWRWARNPYFLYGLSIVSVILLWQFVATQFFTPAFFPPPLQVFYTGLEMIQSGELAANIAISMQRILLGFFIGSLIATPLGLIMGSNRIVRTLFEPYINFFRFVPAIAWLTPVVIWFGIGETSKVIIIIYTTVFIVLVNTIVGVSNIPANKLRAAASLGANSRQAFFYVTLPATLPFILTGMRLAMGNSFMTVVSAEMLAADSGLGYLIFNSRLWMATDRIFIGIVSLGVLGMLSDWIFRWLIQRYASHYGPVE